MGFIERLRQEREARERLSAAETEDRRRREFVLRDAEQRQKREQESRSTQRLSQSIRFHKESGMPSLLKELCDVTSSRVWGNVNKYSAGLWNKHIVEALPYDNDYTGRDLTHELSDLISKNQTVMDSVVCEVILGGVPDSRRRFTNLDYFSIETCPDGTLNFQGGRFGSSIIRQVEWREDKGSLESALEKAYRHPKKRREKIYTQGFNSRR